MDNYELDIVRHDFSKATYHSWNEVSVAPNHIDILDILLASVNKADSGGWIPCHVAARDGHLAIVKFCIANGADINRAKHDGWTPCHLAAANGELTILKLLVSHGAVFDTLNADGDKPCETRCNPLTSGVVLYLEALVNVRCAVCYVIGIRKGTNHQGMGDFQQLPKEIVLMIARYVWATRDDTEWNY